MAEEEKQELHESYFETLPEKRDLELDKNYMNYPKYSKEAPFMDPVVRCDSCNKIVRVKYLNQNGACVCGCRKVKEIRNLEEDEMEAIQKEFPDFAAVFEPNEDEGAFL